MSSSDSSDFFGENGSSDEFIPPTSPEDSSSDDVDSSKEQSRIKKSKLTLLSRDVRKRRLDFSTTEKETEQISGGLELIQGVESNIESNDDIQETPKKLVRKRIPDVSKWKSVKLKKAHQSGEEYISRRGKKVNAKSVKTIRNCIADNCRFQCMNKITEDERMDIHTSFHSLRNSTEKRHFIISTSRRCVTAKPKKIDYNEEDSESNENDSDVGRAGTVVRKSRRKYSFSYYFNVKGEEIQVCKKFYLGTLDISQKPVYTAHNSKNVKTNTPQADKRGKSVTSRRKPTGNAEFARHHIKSFPTIEAHYCRMTTNRLYLGAHLSVGKMIELYKEQCSEKGVQPVKDSQYRKIFNTEFNLGFHIPKMDRCDFCEMYKMAEQTGTLTEKLESDHKWHINLKNAMRLSQKKEKEEKDLPVLLFDLENVILTPHAEISSLFYLRKLTCFNLTVYYSVTKKVYCALWNETLGGRSGNDIASAFRRILEVVVEENDVTELITWSDSCVPQNKNSIMSNAILDFLRDHPEIKSVTMKYSLPGHSCVQEVDNVHSQIEKAMNKIDFYSPIGLIRLLKGISHQNPYKIIQMKASDFKNFAETRKLLNYKAVPYTQVSVIKYTQAFGEILFKSSHEETEPYNRANIKFMEAAKQRKSSKKTEHSRSISVFEVRPKVLKNQNNIPELKKKDIKSAFPFMPLQDREFYNLILK